MTDIEKIRESLNKFVESRIDSITLQGTVTNIDNAESEATISVNIGESIVIDDVRLRSVISDNKGFTIIPKVNSQVLLLRLTNSDDFFVVASSEVEKVIFKGTNTGIELNNDYIIFNNNALSGFIPDITKLVNKINALETKVNSIIDKLKLVVIPLAPSGTYPLSTDFGSMTNLTSTTINDIKDPKIKN